MASDVIFEMIEIGEYLKVNAIDVKTGEEVSVSGPAIGCVEELKRIALRKLMKKLNPDDEDNESPKKPDGSFWA